MSGIRKKIKNKETSPYVYVGYACNNNCIFCSEADEYLSGLKEKSIAEIRKELRIIRKKYDFVSIMGREPTVRKDILEIIRFARSLKFRQVGLTTNGRMFSISSFTKAVLATGINQIGVSLSGASARIHDRQTLVPGSFKQTIAGIKSIIRYKGKNTSLLVNLPMNRLNYRNLGAELELLTGLRVREINILNISPLSTRSATKKLIMPMPRLGAYVFNVLKRGGFLNKTDLRVLLVEFPPCSLPKEAQVYSFPCLEKNNDKVRISLCRQCSYKIKCDGILNSYLRLYGDNEFILE
ncbi:MAG: Fe-S oxidoreductase [Parcubacteria group bacterium GW2011_GWF2_46_8]|nr:MAG: Fe-S oxidoreductase [Parcubacteria group bacterium GW2011_GWF1_45_5]KKU47859.1 MAG: Fe-S oxidoreductase [Parcubacteria group bacterium GW2011_GWF2_46_8]